QAEGGGNPQTAHVLDIGLHLIKTYRGLGVGSRMLQYAVEWAGERGFKKLEASIFTLNQRSLGLFSRAGFNEEGTRRKQYRIGNEYIDEVITGKVL
ncbi:MAG: GNAT family N-acetyltransferase, partial [Firmicutes bacterium]|nr:GNAT family N-acetyltransferase [Bacillota bacterium]